MSLTLGTQPGFVELADTSFAAGNPATSALMTSLQSLSLGG